MSGHFIINYTSNYSTEQVFSYDNLYVPVNIQQNCSKVLLDAH